MQRRLARRLVHVTRQLAQILEEVVTDKPSKTTAKRSRSAAASGPLEEAVLEVLASGAVIAPKVLARKAGYPYNSRFRAAMTGLARRGLVTRTPDGYRRVTPGTTEA